MVIGYDEKGLPKTKNVLAKTKGECIEKLKQLQEQYAPPKSDKIKPEMPFGDWIDFWYQTYVKSGLRPTTQHTYETNIYQHVIPQLVAAQEDPRIEGLLVLLNTVGGDVEAGLALAELIASVSKPSATLVLGGGHSIGIPLAVSARRSFIVPTATMTVHPVRHSGVILGVPQTMRSFEQMQQRITGFVAAHSGMTEKRYTDLMLHTGELVMDMGTVLDGRRAVKEKLIDELGGLSDALAWLYKEIERK